MLVVLDAGERERLRVLVDQAIRARLRGERVGFCAACGAPWWERTRGCPRCQVRHSRRRLYGVNGHAFVLAERRCRCGVAWSENTPGCDPCRKRDWRRRRAGQPRREPLCSGCGVAWDENTPGCGGCRVRHHARSVRAWRVTPPDGPTPEVGPSSAAPDYELRA